MELEVVPGERSLAVLRPPGLSPSSPQFPPPGLSDRFPLG